MIWKEKTRGKAQKILERRIRLGNKIEFLFESEILQKELALLGQIDYQSTLFTMTLFDAIEKGNNSLDEFEKEYEKRVKFHSKFWTYNIYFPLYLNFPKRKIRIHNTTFTKVSFNSLYKLHDRDKLIAAIKASGIDKFDKTNIPKYALCVTTTGNNKFEAWDNISEQFYLLRGIIDFATLCDQLNYKFKTDSRTKNEHPQWGILLNTQQCSTEFITFRVSKEPRVNTFKWTKKQLKIFGHLLNISRDKSTKDKSISVVADCLRLYGQAMESIHSHNCFLSLWQAAETLTRSEVSGGKTDNVIKRLSWHLDNYSKMKGIELSESINELALKRNEIVHRGIDRTQNSDINLLKSLCDIGIKWLSYKQKSLKTINHLDEFYRLRTSNKAQRKAIIETVKSL